MSSPEKTEKLLSKSSEDVILISDGLTKQHFIEIDRAEKSKGILYEALLLNDYWHPVEEEKENQPENKNELQDDLTTEISEAVVFMARKRLESFFLPPDSSERIFKPSNTEAVSSTDYLNKNSDQIKDELIDKANVIYNQSLILFEEGNYEKALSRLRKAFNLNSFNIQYYLLKCESYLQLCDFKSALLTINKLLSIISVWADKEDPTYDELKIELLNKIAFCHYSQGITNFDCKLYIEALESFNKATDLKPNNINYKIRRYCFFCLYSFILIVLKVSYFKYIMFVLIGSL
jgi:tetratricopeptide (TPR) repeat protein